MPWGFMLGYMIVMVPFMLMMRYLSVHSHERERRRLEREAERSRSKLDEDGPHPLWTVDLGEAIGYKHD